MLIDVQRGHPPAVAWFSGLAELPQVTGYVFMELIQNSRNKRQVAEAMELVAPLEVVWPDEHECGEGLALFRTLHLTHGIGLLDTLIAACALNRGAALLTFNTKHYRHVPGLRIEQPYVR